MNLDDFISQTIINICSGIAKAKKNNVNNNGAIAPHKITTPEGRTLEVHKVREIEFDLSVTLSQNNNLEIAGGGSAGLKPIANVEIDIGKNSSSAHEQTQRIKFSVPFISEAII